jgi:hypothetical protein
VAVAAAPLNASPRPASPKAESATVAIDSDDIGGVVTSSTGPEAGVWVIAETNDLPTRFRKIVVTDDSGRYLLPDLPKVNYKVWVRGYGLVDSKAVEARPGVNLNLTALIAPTPQAAAEYYPGNYWYSLMKVPPKSEFPMPPGDTSGDVSPLSLTANIYGTGARQLKTQAEWIDALKSGCNTCHQMGTKPTRSVEPTHEAWSRVPRIGQVSMASRFDVFGRERAFAMFMDWTKRIREGEVPPSPPRPTGMERNVVVTLWDFSVPVSFIHDIISTNKTKPTMNGYGKIFGADWSQGALMTVDPVENARAEVKLPLRNEEDRKLLPTWSPPKIDLPSPVWGNTKIWDDPVNGHTPSMDSKGRVWVNVQNRGPVSPAFCKAGSGNPYAEAYPIEHTDGWGVDVYDPKTGKMELIDLCFRSQHTVTAHQNGKPDEIIAFSISRGAGGAGWINPRIWDETHDAQKAQGWCRPIIDYNGDGKTGAYTMPKEPADPKLDRFVPTVGYGVAFNQIDGSIWYANTGPVPGKIVRISPGANPPATCMTEIYEPPYDSSPKTPGITTFTPRGIDVDNNGIIWTALAGSGHLASFDRSKCKVRNGPTATGQHCPEGWTLYRVPGPMFKGVNDAISDWFYLNWTDRFNVLGLGPDTQVVNGTDSDSLIVFLPKTKQWITMRVPYPMGFYTRNLDGRIDDPKAGWKGRGLWSANETRVIWHTEGGKGTLSQVGHFQLRPNPLAK